MSDEKKLVRGRVELIGYFEDGSEKLHLSIDVLPHKAILDSEDEGQEGEWLNFLASHVSRLAHYRHSTNLTDGAGI